MRVLWDRGQASVAEVQAEMKSETPLAYSTVATVLARLERNGIVRCHKRGRSLIYRPLLAEHRVDQTIVSDLITRLFAGRPSLLLSHLLETEEISFDELARIKALVADKCSAAKREQGTS